jgi:hypothetical protein
MCKLCCNHDNIYKLQFIEDTYKCEDCGKWLDKSDLFPEDEKMKEYELYNMEAGDI